MRMDAATNVSRVCMPYRHGKASRRSSSNRIGEPPVTGGLAPEESERDLGLLLGMTNVDGRNRSSKARSLQ